mgnify:CR=1 FL=1|jgi:hypothetical protein
MKKLIELWYRLTVEDFDLKLNHARKTYKDIATSTRTNICHFYDVDGKVIRGYHKPSAKFIPNTNIHPLTVKYN